MKTINLEEILQKHSNICIDDWEGVTNAMREACNKTLDLAAHEAQAKQLVNPSAVAYAVVDKESILKLKDWIK